MRTEHHVSLAPLTTLQLGGPAQTVLTLDREDEVVEALGEIRKRNDSFFVLAGGSNVVIADAGYSGTVLKMAMRGILSQEKRAHEIVLDVAAGESWDDLVSHAVTQGWSKLESLSGIPGQVGASPIQNIGAYGYEVASSIESVRAFDTETGTFVRLGASECDFGYRRSRFKQCTRWIVTSVRFRLTQGEGTGVVRYKELAQRLGIEEGAVAPLSDIRRVVLDIRRQKSMLYDPADPDARSAGSFMTNPILTVKEFAELESRAARSVPHYSEIDGRFKVPAAWLIEHAGFSRGYRRGQVGISSKHCLALVNLGQGTTRELLHFADEIRAKVFARFGVRLSLEPVVIS